MTLRKVIIFFVVVSIFVHFPLPALSGSWFEEWKDKIVYYHDLLEKLIFLPELPPPSSRIDVLIIGLDGRRGQPDRRSDAIHCFTLWPYSGKIRIVSIPRGTMSEKIMEGKEIIASSFSTGGKELTIECVESYLDLTVDYYVIVGFSQAQAIFEKLGYDGEKTLQVLRARKVYLIGDPQRCHNQAFFMASEILRNYPYFVKYPTLGRALLFVAREIVDTDMPFELMVQIADLYIENGITEIKLLMKPEHHMVEVEDIEITPETIDAILEEQKEKLEENEEAVKDIEETEEADLPPMSEYLAGIIYYYRSFLGKDDRGIIMRNRERYEDHLWYQVEGKKRSERLHFEFTELLYHAYFNLGEYNNAREIAQSFMDERSLDLINQDYKLRIGEMIVRCEKKLYAESLTQ
jgi:anionic cell wall polymer biosynthesis LytR-Cps2A-Psr (LCP) family protein